MAKSGKNQLARQQKRVRGTRSIAFYLAVLAFITLVPAIGFSAILLDRNNQAQERIVETLVVGTSRSIVQAVEREVAAKITTLRVIASTASLLEGDFSAFHERTRQALAQSGSFLFMLDENFYTVLSTRSAYGLPPVKTADVPSASKALRTGAVVVSNVLQGAVSLRWVYNILLPTVLDDGRNMVLVLNQNADALSSALLSNKMPQGWNVALVDATGLVVAASPGAGASGDAFDFFDPAAVSSTTGWLTLDHDRRSYSTVIQRSLMTGWTLVAWTPSAALIKPFSDAVWSLVLGGVLLTALVGGLMYWISGQISRSVRGLAKDARQLVSDKAVPARQYPVAEIALVSDAIENAARERHAAEAEVRFLMRELAHRSKNQMTVIAAMAKQSARTAEDVPQFVDSFQKRILGLARSTDLLLAHGVAGVDLKELLSHQVGAFSPEGVARVKIEGPSVRLNSQAAQTLGMAAHELATNAVKYGAFSNDTGTLRVSWQFDDDALVLVWRETIDHMPIQTGRRGFGSTVLETMVKSALNADVERILHANGIEWTFRVLREMLDPDLSADKSGELDSDEREAMDVEALK